MRVVRRRCEFERARIFSVKLFMGKVKTLRIEGVDGVGEDTAMREKCESARRTVRGFIVETGIFRKIMKNDEL